MGLRQWGKTIKVILAFHKIRGEIERRIEMGWDWKLSAWKGVKAGFVSAVGVCCTALLAWLATPGTVEALFAQADMPTAVALIALPIVHGVIESARNASKHAGKS